MLPAPTAQMSTILSRFIYDSFSIFSNLIINVLMLKFLRHVFSVNQRVMPYGGGILDFAIEDI